MTHDERMALIDAFWTKCRAVLDAKGRDYSQPKRSNFVELAERLGVSAASVWAIYWQKHVCAIEAWCRTGNVKSEPLESRIIDAVNYLVLLVPLLVELGPGHVPSVGNGPLAPASGLDQRRWLDGGE